MEIKIKKQNEKFLYGELCGLTFYKNNIECRIVNYDAIHGKLDILIDQYGNEMYMVSESLSLAFGEEEFLFRLKTIYGITIIEEIGLKYSGDIVNNAMSLKSLGFDYIEIMEDGKIIAKTYEDLELEIDVTKKMNHKSFGSRSIGEKTMIPLSDIYKHLIR